MSEETINYGEIDFKLGLEIHQQLDTSKLFCNCPSLLRTDEPDFEIKRKLHVVAGESGEIDVAAKYEAEQDKEFIYQGYNTVCLVELDEEPPHEINKKALEIVLQISILLNAKIIPITQIMRKTVVNGSNTSGFQRTLMIAKQGYVDTKQGRVNIRGIFLEEDAARHVKTEDKKNIFKLDRLGIPLVEVSTEPDIKTPEQAKEVALHIGKILRSCKVKRGIGTIRQDVNISIKNGNRVEMKGMQDMKIFTKAIENEVKRQQELIKENKKVEPEVRNALPDATSKFLRPIPGAARMYPETDLPLLKISRDMINKAKKTMPELKENFEEELKEIGLNQEMIKIILKENKIEEFKELLTIINKPNLVAKTMLVLPKEVVKHSNIPLKKIENIITRDIIIHTLESVKNKKISESQIKQVFEKITKGENLNQALKFQKHDMRELEEKIHKIIKEKPGLSEKAYMGLVMNEFRGKVNGKEVIEIIKKFME